MAKSSIIYTCTECSHQAPKWEGRCQQCESWGTLMEGEKMAPTQRDKKIAAHARSPKEFTSVLASLSKSIATATGIEELDRVLGGGIVDGALILLTGEPGIGKSTLTLQIANALSQQSKKILYISGEESEEQISLRGQRLNLQLQNLHILAEQNLESVIATAEQEKPELLIIDSIQVMSSGALPGGGGGTSQVRFCTEQLLEFAKPRNIPVLIIGHVTKDGNLAGPRVLEHLVDTVLYFEGSRSHELRMLRPVKNRFGSTQEVGIFAMDSKGLQPIDNVQDFFLKDRHAGQIGTCLVATMEGSRPIIVEVQALTNKTAFGYPKRTTSGFDLNRLNLLMAVLERHCGVRLSEQDVYINVVSGYRMNDPGADLGICMAVLSSYYKKALQSDYVACGEIGLSGEIRKPKTWKQIERELKKLRLVSDKKGTNLQKLMEEYFR